MLCELRILTDVFGDNLFHFPHDGEGVVVLHGDEVVNFLHHLVVLVGADFGNHDFGIGCLNRIFFVCKKFLVKFLARAESREGDLDVLSEGKARQFDHLDGEVVDADGLAHVEDEDFAALAHCAGVDDELARFGDGHEEAGDVGVGDGDGAAFGNLSPENRNDGAVGAQDVAEAGGDKTGGILLEIK